MKVCPKCGYREPFCWRNAYSRGMEVEYSTIQDLEYYFPEIVKKLREAVPNNRGLREWQDEYYAYGLWKSGYVRRRDIEIWKYQKWKAIPMEKATPPKKYEVATLEV